jgi:hypothetical protein
MIGKAVECSSARGHELPRKQAIRPLVEECAGLLAVPGGCQIFQIFLTHRDLPRHGTLRLDQR